MSQYLLTPKEVVTRGEEIYQQIRDRVDAGNHGEFVVIDVKTGEYELGADDVQATMSLLARRPDAITYGVRIGSPVAYKLGAQGAGAS